MRGNTFTEDKTSRVGAKSAEVCSSGSMTRSMRVVNHCLLSFCIPPRNCVSPARKQMNNSPDSTCLVLAHNRLYITLGPLSCFPLHYRECDMGCCFSEPIDFDSEVSLYHFDLHRVVGKGAFGKVRVVEHKRSKKLYALKYIDKTRCIRQKAVANIVQERRLLEEIDHIFIVNLRYAFQDDENCFFVLDLMLGGDLRFHLERSNYMQEDAVRFWVAELSSALDYLHRQRIIHRDIKPDNILLDSMGHAHITDFNVAIHYSDRRLHTSVAGSMAYMAPQVIGKKGYSWQVDWWSLGVTAYELLFRKRPFDGRNAEKMTHSILKDSLTFPENMASHHSSAAISALRGFIDRDPHTRLGCRPNSPGLESIRRHPWFASFDWDALERKDCQPPFVPDMKQANFDVAHELDEFLLAEKPLTHTKRKANPDLEKMRPELRQLEEHFTVYDFSRMSRMPYDPLSGAVDMQSGATDKTLAQSATGTINPVATVLEHSRPGSTDTDRPHFGKTSITQHSTTRNNVQRFPVS